MPKRVCSVCGGEKFDYETWECVECMPPREIPPAKDEAEGGGEGGEEREGGEPDSKEGEGEGEGKGNGDDILLEPGEYIELPDGTLCLVLVFSDLTFWRFVPGSEILPVIVLATGNCKFRLRSVTEQLKAERLATTTMDPGDFLFTGAKQEVIINPALPVLDNCEYAVVKLDGTGEVIGLTKEEAKNVVKVED